MKAAEVVKFWRHLTLTFELERYYSLLNKKIEYNLKTASQLPEASIMGRPGGPNVLSGATQLLNGPTQYLTRQRLPMARVKRFLAVFVVPLLALRVVFIVVDCAGWDRRMLTHSTLLFCVCCRH